MNNPDRAPNEENSTEETSLKQGPNLFVAYSLMALAFLIALGVAILIVLPFYRHRSSLEAPAPGSSAATMRSTS